MCASVQNGNVRRASSYPIHPSNQVGILGVMYERIGERSPLVSGRQCKVAGRCARHFEHFATQLTENEKAQLDLLAAVYRERAQTGTLNTLRPNSQRMKKLSWIC